MKREDSPHLALLEAAEAVLAHAYAPYSSFHVGAALEDVDGRIWTGCNVENAAFSAGICAERTALFKAVSEGVTSFVALAIVGRKADATASAVEFTTPCGVCRQALNEFCDAEMPVVVAGGDGEVREYTLNELLPGAFGPKNLSDTGKRSK